MSTLGDRILEVQQKGYHCSQIMMQLSMEMRGIDDPFTIRTLGALGGGMFAQRTCGTLTGGVCALSSYFPREEGQPEPTGYQELANELVQWFEEEFGSIDCRDLVEFDIGHILQVCPGMMEKTFEKVIELLEDYGIDPAG